MPKIHQWWKILLYYTWFIVIWGAFVRASGSGDGCGKNWPTCHGELIPTNSSIQTMIEYIHRATSGIYGIFVFALVIITLLSLRKNLSFYFSGHFEDHSPADLAKNKTSFKIKLAYLLPILVLFLTIFEALIGAKLVLSGLVGSNTSWARANIMILHLLNTFLLVASIIGTTYFLTPIISPKNSAKNNDSSEPSNLKKSLYSLCTLSLILVAGLGALTALGDTLYPSDSLHHGVYQDFALNSPWILRLRVFHPLFAVLTVFLITIMCQDFTKNKQIKIYLFLTYFTLFVGITNLLLLAPIYMQLIHLLTAQALWSAHSQLGFQLFIPKIKNLVKN